MSTTFPATNETTRARWPRTLDLRKFIAQGDTVVWSHAGAEPIQLINQFLDQRHNYGGRVSVILTGISFSDIVREEHCDVIDFKGIGGIGTHKRLAKAGLLGILPYRYGDMPALLKKGEPKVDVLLLSASLPDADGNVSIGVTAAILPDIMACARVKIVEINPNVPYVGGDTIMPLDAFDAVSWSDREPVYAPAESATPSTAVLELCKNVASLVPDGATIQIGIGSTGTTLPRLLADRQGLGIHSAILTDGLVDLIEAGVASGSLKERDEGIAVAGELIGSERLFRYCHRNPLVALKATSYILSETALGSFTRLISVNGAIEVDLTGQVNAETLNGVHVGAVGGQVDFVRAAARAEEGASIIALPAVARDGSSRIVTRLGDGVVTTARSEIEYVVTEYGIAKLRGATLPERARALAAVAHPDHRESLLAQARTI